MARAPAKKDGAAIAIGRQSPNYYAGHERYAYAQQWPVQNAQETKSSPKRRVQMSRSIGAFRTRTIETRTLKGAADTRVHSLHAHGMIIIPISTWLTMIQFQNALKFYKTKQHVKIVLNNVSTVFETGWSYGLLGVNGAGKSTLLRLAAGTELPNAGRVLRTGRISWPLGFSGGFHPQVTGRENIKFVARIYGEDIQRVTDFVEDFSELGDYLDAPVGTYSSGMVARLAFGLSMAVQFDCYLIDEITAVGDARFQKRCQDAFEERRKTADLIIASHSIGTIKAYCTRAAVLVDGHLLMFDSVEKAVEVYTRLNR